MAIVLIFNENYISAFRFKKRKKQYILAEKDVIKNIQAKELLTSPQQFGDLLISQFANCRSDKFYILMNGLDVQYRSFAMNISEIESLESSQVEEHILHRCKANLPKIMDELHKSYIACVMTECKTSKALYFSSAFIPSEYLSTIKTGFNDNNFCLMGVFPKAFCLYNSLRFQPDESLIYQDNADASGLSHKGLYVWPKPSGCQLSPEDVKENIQNNIEKSFDYENGILSYIDLDESNFHDYIRDDLNVEKSKAEVDIGAVIAVGAILPYSATVITEYTEEEEQQEGGIKGVITQLRQLFNRQREEE